MTDSKVYNVRGAEVTVTANLYPRTIDIHITVDLSNLDQGEPDHSPHQLIAYLMLPNYSTASSYWWARTHRKVTCHTGAQARRIVKHALAKIDDAIEAALVARASRKQHLADVFTD